ncbi:colicin-like pore-forming protein [Pseudomonas fontis]|uniref:Colicin-like pore-forming protein n=1 Tax=Pseudomonas fontis TaxID=2942633 RepID=A0ABT5NPK1_9PSED|nr:colicin-like pore-forming protein [Pseudomonas fontis]MDD0972450.1 colicin-like pore-forming protein [Pseudomonas fontis]MDD0990093.1 colicin-like pore-forming protein [Pseudomonas fontis]
MTEKNIIVDRGIPPSGSSTGAGGGAGGIFGGFWGSTDMSTMVGSVVVSVDGVSKPDGPALNAAAMITSVAVESVLSGDGWPSMDAYHDLGVGVWGVLPYQILEVRDELRGTFIVKERNLPNTLDAEQRAGEAAAGSTAALSQSEKIKRTMDVIKGMMAKRNELIKFNRGLLSTSPGTDLLERDINKMVSDLRPLSEDNIPGAINQVLNVMTAGLSLHVDLTSNQMLQAKLDALQPQYDAAASQEAYISNLAFAADVGKEVSTRFGAQMGQAAKDLQQNISGKTVKSYDQALQTFDKLVQNPGFKVNQKDTAAITQALRALDVATYADNAQRLGKAFGVTGKVVQAVGLGQKAADGFATGDWKPFMLELQAVVVSTAVGAAAGALLGAGLALVLAPGLAVGAGIIATGVILAAVSSFINAAAMESLNGMVLNAISN